MSECDHIWSLVGFYGPAELTTAGDQHYAKLTGKFVCIKCGKIDGETADGAKEMHGV